MRIRFAAPAALPAGIAGDSGASNLIRIVPDMDLLTAEFAQRGIA
jgi:hypothetical protein